MASSSKKSQNPRRKQAGSLASEDAIASRSRMLNSFIEYLDEEAARNYNNSVWDGGVAALVDGYDGFVPQRAIAALADYNVKTLAERRISIERAKASVLSSDPQPHIRAEREGLRDSGLHPDFTTWAGETGIQRKTVPPRQSTASHSVGNAERKAGNVSPLAARGVPDARLRSMPYGEYLQTSHWRQMRKEALSRAHNRCQFCNAAGNLEVHHRTYERRGSERADDLIVLCNRCHGLFHKKNQSFSRRRRRTQKSSGAMPKLLVAIAVVGVFALIALPRYRDAQNVAATATAESRSSENAMATYDASANATATAFHSSTATARIATAPPVSAATPTITVLASTVETGGNDNGGGYGPGGICPPGLPIKGNSNSGIYHVPGDQYYDVTNARHCFATEQDAINAGYRKSKV